LSSAAVKTGLSKTLKRGSVFSPYGLASFLPQTFCVSPIARLLLNPLFGFLLDVSQLALRLCREFH